MGPVETWKVVNEQRDRICTLKLVSYKDLSSRCAFDDCGIIYEKSMWAHTFCDKHPVDLIWIASYVPSSIFRDIISVDGYVKPRRFMVGPRGAVSVIKVPAGTLADGSEPRRLVWTDNV